MIYSGLLKVFRFIPDTLYILVRIHARVISNTKVDKKKMNAVSFQTESKVFHHVVGKHKTIKQNVAQFNEIKTNSKKLPHYTTLEVSMKAFINAYVVLRDTFMTQLHDNRTTSVRIVTHKNLLLGPCSP